MQKPKPDVMWQEIKLMYQNGNSLTDIVATLTKRGEPISRQAIYKRMKKEDWTVIKQIRNGLIESNAEGKLCEAPDLTSEIEEEEMEAREILDQLKSAVIRGIRLKNYILQSTINKFRVGEINEPTASKIVANLGLTAVNIANILGVTQNKSLQPAPEKDVSESQIQVYIPDNNRN